MIKFKMHIFIFVSLLMLSACSHSTDSLDSTNLNINGSQVVEESDYYKVIRFNSTYYYTIFNKNHNIAKFDGPLDRQPHILMADEQLVRFTLQAGTGIGTQWGYFYNIQTDKFSEVFNSILDQSNGKVALGDNKNKKVIIRDIFNLEKYYYEISSFSHSLSQNAAEPIINAKFINNGASIEVSYLSDTNYRNVTETIALT